MLRVLFVPFYVGELGWELINYIPHVNYFLKKNKYDEIHVVVKKDYRSLYPMGTHFYVDVLKRDKGMGNSGEKQSATNKKVLANLRKRKQKNNLHLDVVDAPRPGMSFYKNRSFLQYEYIGNCAFEIPDNAVAVCIRGRKRGKHKNWDAKCWIYLCEFLSGEGFSPVLIGISGVPTFEAPSCCLDLRGKTNMGDVIDIMHRSKFVIGQSTGTTHLAALCGTLHAVWGSKRIQERYLGSWNPFNTPVEYYACREEFIFSLDEGIQLACRVIKRLGE